ncbi:hypothetical protein DICPUDRAFT_148018 [Dictyostelium purpureum]|uniref:Uncharacterized protein n=1 Tax=Dictyostelium purpureum TaxID=5786 RepID=F0ZA13_DICPU|nr:uncharacterized protein DICPUDRAFT_148018 [Dictyostelium purpureum]EGC39245.1 hypothetical protein DICPUDRAFT_148018 [Dictyostelium purpureum]|eukprot:XP_003284272.1 hypothetical protein DICPUDRAFT_148018 [Dictyostelium purpureum]
MMIKIIFIILNLILILNPSYGYQYTSVQYEKQGCGGQIVAMQASTLCSPLGRFKYAGNGIVQYTYANEINSIEECTSVTEYNVNQTLTVCQNDYFKFYLNEENPVALAEGFCGTVKMFDDNCDYLQINSYVTGACEKIDNAEQWYRYVCDGTTVNRYTCTKDCSNADNLGTCTLDQALPTIESCKVPVKKLSDIIDDSEKGSSSNSSSKLVFSVFAILSSILLILFN